MLQDVDWLKGLLEHVFILVFCIFYPTLAVSFSLVLENTYHLGAISWVGCAVAVSIPCVVVWRIADRRLKNSIELLKAGEFVKKWDVARAVEEYLGVVEEQQRS